MTASAPVLEVHNLAHSYAREPVLSGVTLSVDEGSILCLLGRSGHGKSTLLRIIAGLERPAAGDVRMDGQLIGDLSPYRRSIGMVFQSEFALFPHLNVFENVLFPFRHGHREVPGEMGAHELVRNMLKLTSLDLEGRTRIHELSGGMKQRVALARALVYRPKLLLLDEPFSSLDNVLKDELIDLLRSLRDQTRTAMILVTHDEREVDALADKVAVLDRPTLVAYGSVRAIRANPPSQLVKTLLRIP